MIDSYILNQKEIKSPELTGRIACTSTIVGSFMYDRGICSGSFLHRMNPFELVVRRELQRTGQDARCMQIFVVSDKCPGHQFETHQGGGNPADFLLRH
jgi:hypothetical protein